MKLTGSDFEEKDGVLTKLNLLEIYYRSLEQYDSKVALDILGKLLQVPS